MSVRTGGAILALPGSATAVHLEPYLRDDIDTRLDPGDLFLGDFGNAVEFMYGGTFNGGTGNDYIYYMQNATFNGGDGNDRVQQFNNGAFNGGDGFDSIGEWYGDRRHVPRR